MSDLNDPQIEQEFRWQIYLCSGLGPERMAEILANAWRHGPNYAACRECKSPYTFSGGHVCSKKENVFGGLGFTPGLEGEP